MRIHTLLLGSATMAWAATATAEPASWHGTWNGSRPWTGYVRIDPSVTTKGGESSNIIYLNRCARGCVITPGDEDSRTNRSSIIDTVVSIPPFSYGDNSWNTMVACVRELYEPFGIEITDVDPGEIPHFEAIVAGNPQDAGFPSQVGGISPYDCTVIDNAITYTFAASWGNEPRIICEVVAQETAHAFGLDHELYCPDPLTYLLGCGDKSFQNYDAPCGEDVERACECGGLTQNSYRRILQLFGPGQASPPSVTITQPLDGHKVTPGFTVRADITDNFQVRRAELVIDGAPVQTLNIPPYVFAAPAALADGSHQVEVRAYDNAESLGSHAITVEVRPPCAGASECGDGFTCVDGRCVAGPGTPGGLGTACADAAECYSGLCAADGSGTRYCVEECEVGGTDCPCGFSCLNAGSSGVCWPGGNECGGGGCAVTVPRSGSGALGPILLGIAVGALFLRRRRR